MRPAGCHANPIPEYATYTYAVNRSHYIPPLRFHGLTPLYDWAVIAGVRAAPSRAALLENARLTTPMTVLDLGCGTGLLTRAVAERQRLAGIVGLDPDGPALAKAWARTDSLSDVALCRGMGGDLPFGAGSFDRVVSSLVFHHLERGEKRRVFREIYRVLKPGGELHFADFTRPHSLLMALCSLPVRLLDGFGPTRDNFSGALPSLLAEAGFEGFVQLNRFTTSCGTLAVCSAAKGVC